MSGNYRDVTRWAIGACILRKKPSWGSGGHMTDNDESPKWVKTSREHLEHISPKIESIKKEGQAEAKRGLEKVKAAGELQQEAEYLERVLSQPHDSQYWTDEIVTLSGIRLANRIELFDQDVDGLLGITREGGEADKEHHVRFVYAMPSTDSSAGTAVYLGASIEARFVAIDPVYRPVLEDFEPQRLTSRDNLFQELRSALDVFGKEYVAMLDGSEKSLELSTPDSLSQAAHSMRDCFQQLLEQLGPTEAVKAQPWFKFTEGAPGGVSRRSRLRYLLYGSGEKVKRLKDRKISLKLLWIVNAYNLYVFICCKLVSEYLNSRPI